VLFTRSSTLLGSTYPVTVHLLCFGVTATLVTPRMDLTAFFTRRSQPSQSIFTLMFTVCACNNDSFSFFTVTDNKFYQDTSFTNKKKLFGVFQSNSKQNPSHSPAAGASS
jgi:hypothetical protein